jgi:hypothetical protein
MRSIWIALFALGLTTAAFAQDHRPNPNAGDTLFYDFQDGSRVGGEIRSPDGDLVTGARRHQHHTLVQPRPHYVPEMLKSVESL